MTVFDNIKKFSKLRGYSLQDTAEKAGLSRNVIYQYKNGKSPTLKNLRKFADVLGVTTNDLLGKPNEDHENKPKHVDLADDDLFMTYQGKPLSDEDKELIKRILRGK